MAISGEQDETKIARNISEGNKSNEGSDAEIEPNIISESIQTDICHSDFDDVQENDSFSGMCENRYLNILIFLSRLVD